MDGRWQIVTAPTAEPVTLAELKSHLRVDNTVEDALIAMYGTAARQAVEDECWLALCPQKWDYLLDAWPASNQIELPRPPLQSITSITYRDSSGTTTTFASTNYHVDTKGDLGRVVLKYGCLWPTATLGQGSPIAVRFVCGYTSAALAPTRAKAAILLLTAELYQYREAAMAPQLVQSQAIQRVLNLLKVRY
jgi:uncharacterized phiE125 gp8 family phage protein